MKRSRLQRWGILGLILLSSCTLVLAQALQVGFGRQDITPKEPVPMWGYPTRHAALSTGTLDSLYANVLVLRVESKKLALISLDLGRSPAETSLERIRQTARRDFRIEYFFIAATHTHHGPVLELSSQDGKGGGRFDGSLRYYQVLEKAILQAIGEADAHCVSARLGSGSTQLEGFNENRQSQSEPKPLDRELRIIRFDQAAGKPLALVVNFAAHPTLLPSSLLQFSSDYIGPLRREIEQRFGAKVLFMQGASGDVSVHPKFEGKCEQYGHALADQVIMLASALRSHPVARPTLDFAEERFEFKSRVDLHNPAVLDSFAQAFFPELVANYASEYAGGVRPLLSVAVLNHELAFVGVSGEFFCGHALYLKQKAPTRQLFFFGCCNGYHQYFPTLPAITQGGYGADPFMAPAEAGAGETMMKAALTHLSQMLR